VSAEPAPEPDTTARRARVRVGAGAALVVVLVALGVAVLITAMSPKGTTATIAPAPSATASDALGVTAGDGPRIFVHILGEVVRPGLYELRDGARGVDAVAAAGGFTDAADPGALNLARFVADGEQILVPALGAAPPAGAGGGGVAADGRVNLNAADVAQLEQLPRIGPAMAERIIAWRDEHGPFRTVEDLLEVSGIGEATLDGLRDLVVL